MSHDNTLFIQNLNQVIDGVIEQIENDQYMSNPQFYNFSANLINEICQKMPYKKVELKSQMVIIQEDRIFEIALDFFKSIDVELYNKAYAIFNKKYPNTKTYIFDSHKEDPDHTLFYHTMYQEGMARVYLPLGYGISKEDRERIIQEHGEDYYTLDDLYSIVHETSHLFDIKPEDYRIELLKTRDVLTEVTPYIFEEMLTDYLLKEGIFDKSAVIEEQNDRSNRLLMHAHIGRIKLKFLELKRKNGKITEEDIISMMKQDMLGEEEFVNILNLVINSGVSLIENRRYASARMFAPIIHQKCKENPSKMLLQKYLDECSQNIPYTDILSAFGIDLRNVGNDFKSDGSIEK